MPKNENIDSWSYFKHNIFNNCERRYYLHYIASVNGSNALAATEEKELYFLKKNISYRIWIENLIIKNIQNIFSTTKDSSYKKNITGFKRDVYKQFTLEKHTIINNSWINDFKSPMIKEILLKNKDSKSILTTAENYFKQIISTLNKSSILEKLYIVPFQSRKNTLTPQFFFLNNIKVWNAPHLAWLHNGRLHNLNFYISPLQNNLNNDNWSIISGVNTLFWQSLLKYHLDYIETINVFIDATNNSVLQVYSRRHPKEVVNLIKSSFMKIKSRQTFSEKVYKKNYRKTNSDSNCKKCKFQSYCFREHATSYSL